MNHQRETLPLFMDIFEPPPHWRTGVNIEASAQRSPLQHQPSLSEIIFQDYNNHLPDQNASHDFESVASLTHASPSQHQIETLGHHSNEESVYEDTQAEIDLSQQQADDASLTASIFTAAEYSDDSDDNSSIKNTRHGHLSNQPSMDNMHDVASAITIHMKKLDIHNVLEWQDYRPQYKLLNESYDDMKIEIYNEIYSIMKKMQILDQKFNMSKANFYHEMEKEYEVLSISLLSQCHELKKEKQEYKLNSTAIN
ncbi:hypothetical protein EDC96DRAFT_235368 [Choanephora cucurbitarum]|nr:hypothetical protein EDC96DRAFT_235368 [Choanephora cucurbitarum]